MVGDGSRRPRMRASDRAEANLRRRSGICLLLFLSCITMVSVSLRSSSTLSVSMSSSRIRLSSAETVAVISETP